MPSSSSRTRACIGRGLPKLAALAWLGLLAGCTVFVRAGVGPSIDTDGRAGGLVVLSAGAAFGDTNAGAAVGTSYDASLAFAEPRSAPNWAWGFGMRGFGGFGARKRFGVGAAFDLVFGRTPEIYRGRVGFGVSAGLRIKLAGTNGHTTWGSCGMVNDGDRWGLFVFADTAFDAIRGDEATARRFAFPLGVELRVNVVP